MITKAHTAPSGGRTRRLLSRAALTGVFAGAAALALATPALAAPFSTTASATALQLTAIGGAVTASTGAETATNDGSTATVSESESPLISVLGTQSVITAGVLAETAVANNDGTAEACAGLTGPDGTVDVGDTSGCVEAGDAVVTLVLGSVPIVGTPITITADVIESTCTSDVGTATGSSTIAGVSVNVGGIPLLQLTATGAANQQILPGGVLAGLLSITINEQTTGPNGQITVTALSVSALGAALVGVDVATVSCGPAADLAAVAALPKGGLGVAAGVLGLLAVGFVARRRRSSAV